MEFTVKVEQRHIDQVAKNTTHSCPIATAFKETVQDNPELPLELTQVLNDHTAATHRLPNRPHDSRVIFNHSQEICEFIKQFDKLRTEHVPPGPITIRFQLPDLLTKQYEYGTADVIPENETGD